MGQQLWEAVSSPVKPRLSTTKKKKKKDKRKNQIFNDGDKIVNTKISLQVT